VAEVERTNTENARLHQVMSDQQAELDKVRKEREATERRYRQSQVELGLAQLELTVAKDDVQKARASRAATVKENDRLRSQIEKRTFTAQANLKCTVERFRDQTNVAIQVATAVSPSEEKLRLAWVSNGMTVYADTPPAYSIPLHYPAL
jgi:septal ring factor EnvC (AmiA/AmiB activator)